MPTSTPLIWRHVILSTYGSWLPGDKRGFRTPRHREHIEGDYKNPPPPGKYGRLEEVVRRAMTQPAAALTAGCRAAVGMALRDRLDELGGLTLCVAVSTERVHLLSKMPQAPAEAWKWIGAAKRHAWFTLRDQGHHERLWAGKGKAIPIGTREYQLRVYHYIVNHARQGAWVWWLDDRPPEEKT